MPIRIIRNESANCITFQGTSVPAYFNACLSGEVSSLDPDKVNIKNDIRSADQQENFYEFSNIHYTEFEDKDGNVFNSAQDVADYITAQGNVIGVNVVGQDLTGITVNFRLDQTSTSIIMDNGSAFGVNTIKAVADGGLIKIKSIGEGIPTGTEDPVDRVHFENLDHTLVKINGINAVGGLADVVDQLNELFTVGAFEAVVIRDPYSTLVADVGGVDLVSPTYIGNSINPVGNDVFAASASGSLNGYLSTETIDQAGEYFTFDIRVESVIGMGLVHSQDSYDNGYYIGNASYANPTTFGTVNSQHSGFQFSHWFHPTPDGPWTNYGANTSYSLGPGWSNSGGLAFRYSAEGADWIAGNPVKMRVGLDASGFISIDYYDVSESTWIVCARTTYSMQEGTELKLGIKMGGTTARLHSLPKVHLLPEAAPTLYFRYIESPDGNYDFPLFASQEEAEYYDDNSGGTGTYTTVVYPDDPTNTVWYRPDNGFTNDSTTAPTGSETFEGVVINWTEITSLT